MHLSLDTVAGRPSSGENTDEHCARKAEGWIVPIALLGPIVNQRQDILFGARLSHGC